MYASERSKNDPWVVARGRVKWYKVNIKVVKMVNFWERFLWSRCLKMRGLVSDSDEKNGEKKKNKCDASHDI